MLFHAIYSYSSLECDLGTDHFFGGCMSLLYVDPEFYFRNFIGVVNSVHSPIIYFDFNTRDKINGPLSGARLSFFHG